MTKAANTEKNNLINIIRNFRAGGDSKTGKRVTFFFGAGINLTFFDNAYGWNELSKKVTDEYVKNKMKGSRYKALISDYLQNSLSNKISSYLVDKFEFKNPTTNDNTVFLNDFLENTSNKHYTNILTLNFDTAIEYLTYWDGYNILSDEYINDDKSIFHLHGKANSKNDVLETDKVIFALNKYVEDSDKVKEFLTDYFNNDSRDIVFMIGTSMEEEHILSVIQNIAMNDSRIDKKFILITRFPNFAHIEEKIKELYKKMNIKLINIFGFKDNKSYSSDLLKCLSIIDTELNKSSQINFNDSKIYNSFQFSEHIRDLVRDDKWDDVLKIKRIPTDYYLAFSDEKFLAKYLIKILPRIEENIIEFIDILASKPDFNNLSTKQIHAVCKKLDDSIEKINNAFYGYDFSYQLKSVLWKLRDYIIENRDKFENINNYLIYNYFKQIETIIPHLDIRDVINVKKYDWREINWKYIRMDKFKKIISNIDFDKDYFGDISSFLKNESFYENPARIANISNANKSILNIFKDNKNKIEEIIITEYGYYIDQFFKFLNDEDMQEWYREIISKNKKVIKFNPYGSKLSFGEFDDFNDVRINEGYFNENSIGNYDQAMNALINNPSALEIRSVIHYLQTMDPINDNNISADFFNLFKAVIENKKIAYSMAEKFRTNEKIIDDIDTFILLKRSWEQRVKDLKIPYSFQGFLNIKYKEDLFDYIKVIESQNNASIEDYKRALIIKLEILEYDDESILCSRLFVKLCMEDELTFIYDKLSEKIKQTIKMEWYSYFTQYMINGIKFDNIKNPFNILSSINIKHYHTHQFARFILYNLSDDELVNRTFRNIAALKKGDDDRKFIIDRKRFLSSINGEKIKYHKYSAKSIQKILTIFKIDSVVIKWLEENSRNIFAQNAREKYLIMRRLHSKDVPYQKIKMINRNMEIKNNKSDNDKFYERQISKLFNKTTQ